MLELVNEVVEPKAVPPSDSEPQVAMSSDFPGLKHPDAGGVTVRNIVSVSATRHLAVLQGGEPSASDVDDCEFLERHFVAYELAELARSPRDSALVVRAAMALIAAGASERALPILAEVLDSEEYWIHHYYAVALSKIGQLAAAEQSLRRIIERRPDDYRPAHALGRLMMQQGRNDEARSLLTAACEKKNADALTFNDCAVANITARDLSVALKLLRRAVRLDETCTHALNNTAVCYQLSGRTEKALQYFAAALRSDPSCHFAVHNIAEAYIGGGDLDAAISLLESHRLVAPADLAALERLAWAYGCAGQHARVVTLLQEGVRLSGERDGSLLNNLAVALMARGKYVPAEQAYRKAIALEPANLGFRMNLARLYQSQGRAAEVLGILDEASGANADALMLRATALVHLQAYEEAASGLWKGHQKFPADSRIVGILGFVLIAKLNQVDAGIALLEDGLEEHPTDLVILNNLAYALLKMNSNAAARKILEPHLEEIRTTTKPAGVTLRATWGLLLVREGAFDEGMSYYGLARSQAGGGLRRRIDQKMSVERGRYLISQRRWREARQALQEALELNADDEFNAEAEGLLPFASPTGSA